jgi:hypothetical protein
MQECTGIWRRESRNVSEKNLPFVEGRSPLLSEIEKRENREIQKCVLQREAGKWHILGANIQKAPEERAPIPLQTLLVLPAVNTAHRTAS